MSDLKSDKVKSEWREFCDSFKHVNDFNFATLLRLDSSKDYEESNSVIVTKVQFYAIELARNREGHNETIRQNFKPKPRTKRVVQANAEAEGQRWKRKTFFVSDKKLGDGSYGFLVLTFYKVLEKGVLFIADLCVNQPEEYNFLILYHSGMGLPNLTEANCKKN